jgi:phage terminase large subunit-like protein
MELSTDISTRIMQASPPFQPSDFYFDRQAALDAIEFFPSCLRHIKGEWAGQPIELADWQKVRVIGPLFGWKRKSDGTRRYRTAYVEIGRKNGKSTLASGIGCYLLFCDHEPGAEVYSAAADREQASIVFDAAREMIEASSHLIGRCKVYRRKITYKHNFWRVLSADVATKHGLNPHAILFDELHTQPNRRLWDVLSTGQGARRQPLLFAMTTAGYDRTSICWETHNYALKVMAGIIPDDSFLGVIFAADPDDDWKSEATWAKANPNMGISPKIEFLRAECKKAQEIPAQENVYKRLYLDLWTEQATRWIPMDKWDECHGVTGEWDSNNVTEDRPGSSADLVAVEAKES